WSPYKLLTVFTFIFQTASKDGEVRLVGGQSSHEGRVEIYYGGQWGTVCDDNWDISDAKVVCRSLGYSDAVTVLLKAAYGAGSGPIMMDEVACTGNEASLMFCRSNGWRRNDCHHSEDAGVICKPNEDESGSEVEGTTHVLDRSMDFAESLKNLYETRQFCDFNISVKTNGKESETSIICTHRIILLLNVDANFMVKDGAENFTLTVDEECTPYVDDFIRYLYIKKISVTLKSSKCIHKLASMYGILELQEFCSQLFTQLLPEDLSFQNQLSLYSYALSTQDTMLADSCLQYLAWNCKAFAESEAWYQLTWDQLGNFLFRSDIVVPDEFFLLEALESWILKKGPNSPDLDKALIQMIRFPMMHPEQLFQLQFNFTLYKSHQDLFQMKTLEALEFHTVGFQNLNQYVDLSNIDYMPRIYTSPTWSYLLSGSSIYNQYNPYYRYDYQNFYSQLRSYSSSFHTPKHTSFLFQSDMIQWSFAYYESAQSCRNSGRYCYYDNYPVLLLSFESRPSSNYSIQYQNKALMICKDSYVSDIRDFKNNLVVLPSNDTSSYTFPCSSNFSYQYVVRPLYYSEFQNTQ
uniref:Galectin 3 binding protein n=1 Tax=Latimeria chalumnae TaxID=7897 RepID=H3B9K6_LATCH